MKGSQAQDYNAGHTTKSTEYIFFCLLLYCTYPSSSDGKESACTAGNLGSIPVLGRSPGEDNGNPL